jgi:FixJ family two-component response regulator
MLRPEPPAVKIVDDDPSVSNALKRLMKTAGFDRVEAFGSAEDFLKHECGPGAFVLVLDVTLPGISGIDLQKFVRTTSLPATTVFISAHENEIENARNQCPEAAGYLLKPFGGQDLLQILRKASRSETGGEDRSRTKDPSSGD